MNSLVSLVVAFAVPQVVGMTAGAATSRSIREWYPSLEKPWYTPPNWLFAPAWLVLYLAMGYASWRVWQVGWGEPGVVAALVVYAVHLVFNALWSIVFFGMRRPRLALFEVAFLWTGVVASTVLFWRVDTLAGVLLLPYVAWVTFAAILNRGIAIRNPSAG